MGSIALEEYELMKDSKYRVYVSAVDKALKNFEYTSEWADLISALGKLNKVLMSHMKFPVIPRRIKISKRLAQCMHPALPSGVHLKALESYDVIFKCMGTNRLSHELFIYSAGLFPLLAHAAMNVRPMLLTVYETHFVPLGERLRPGLSGFLSGVLPGLEEGSDHFERTNFLLEKVCEGVGPAHFFTCLWDCLASNSGIRLPAILFILSHFNKKLTMGDQAYLMGTNVNIMVAALYASVQDNSVLVQRSSLDLLLVGFPFHNSQLDHHDMVLLLTAALVTILRRDMSLNRRLFAWLLGTEINPSVLKKKFDIEEAELVSTYFELYSKEMLIEALKSMMLKVYEENPLDLKPYRILVSLLDKPEIGPAILDDVLYEVFRTFYYACSICDKPLKSHEVVKSANLLFSSLEPAYVWIHCGLLFQKACTAKKKNTKEEKNNAIVKSVASGMPDLTEVCILTEFLLETVSVDAFIDTTSAHLPVLFHDIIDKLLEKLDVFTPLEISKSLGLCRKILSKVQPTLAVNHADVKMAETKLEVVSPPKAELLSNENSSSATPLEKSQSDSKLNTPRFFNNNFIDRSPSPRRRTNSGEPSKHNKKSKKKSSKSASKLNEMYEIHTDMNNILLIGCDPIKSKSIDDSHIDYTNQSNSQYPSQKLTLLDESVISRTINGPSSVARIPSPAQQAQHTMLEKCLRQYEQFYVRLISNRILVTNKTTVDMFQDLIIPTDINVGIIKTNDNKIVNHLENILYSHLKADNINLTYSNLSKIERIMFKPSENCLTVTDSSYWEEVLKLSSNLLVELSTFPTYFQPDNGYLDEEEPVNPIILPEWLQVLIVCCCWLGKQPSLQLTSIATLLDLMALFRAHNNISKYDKCDKGVTTVIMVPLLKKWHITYLTQCTKVFHTLAHSLWHHLGELPAHKYRLRCVELLHELHHSLHESCDAVENVIGSALMQHTTENKVKAFSRFATLWHLSREIETNPRLGGCTKTFDRSLLKMLDNLQLPDCSPLKLHTQSWLLHSLVRGDISRIIDPVLFMLLDSSTCRMSVLHVSIQHSNTVLTKIDSIEEKAEPNDDTERAAKIYAISSVDGNVIYHVSDSGSINKEDKSDKYKKTCINPVKVKRIFAVTTLANTDNGNRYITEKNEYMKELEVPASISGNCNISVFVNPLSVPYNTNMTASLIDNVTTSTNKKINLSIELLKNTSRFKKSSINKDSPENSDINILNKDLYSSSDSLESNTSENTIRSMKLKKETTTAVLATNAQEITSTLLRGKVKYVSTDEFSTAYDMHDTINTYDSSTGVPGWTMGDEDYELDLSTTAEEYFTHSNDISVIEEVLNEVISKVVDMCECAKPTKISDECLRMDEGMKRSSGVGVHNLHSHMLLYCGVYDSALTLYALRTLKNQLITNTRMFLLAATTTGISNVSRSTQLLNLLARHRKSVLGRGFNGDITTTKFIASYRSSMYLEVLIIICLYFVRSYYPNLGQMRLTQEEIAGNRQVQLVSAELLTLIFSELIAIVQDSGKGFSCYIMDLLTKCKVGKVALHCLVSSVLNMKNAQRENVDTLTFTEEIVSFNDPLSECDMDKCKFRASDHTEAYQIQMLRLVVALIMLEYQCGIQKGETDTVPPLNPQMSTTLTENITNLSENALEYITGAPIPNQPLFITSILSALQLSHMRHLHQHWTTLVTSSLPYMGSSLTQVVTSVIYQLCSNIENLATYYIGDETISITKSNDISCVECCLPADYTVTHLEALTFLLQYCLLDNSQQISFSFNQQLNGSLHCGVPTTNSTQVFTNLIHVFTPNLLSSEISMKDKTCMGEQHLYAKRTALNHLPRIIASLSSLWQAVLLARDNDQTSCVVGNPRVVKYQLLELLSPISFHHGVNFLAAVAVVWHERRQSPINPRKVLPESCPNQQVIVDLVSAIRVMPIDTLIQTVNQIIKAPTSIHGVKQDFSLEVSVLEFLYVYMQTNVSQSLVESWGSLLGLLRDGLALTAPAQFLLLAILNEYILKCPPMQEKKDIRDLQDISAKLIESCSQIAGACLEQTTWLRRNLAVREDVLEINDGSNEMSPGTPPNSIYSVQAQTVLAEILAPLLDVSFGSQEKERVVTLLTNVLYNITPYLKNHTLKNISSFIACSQLLSSLSGYQYTRKAWRKDILDLLLDAAFFQMTPPCLPYWRTIIDNLMTHDNTTFRDLMNRVSIAQSSGISIFSSKEQEYEQRAQLLKRLAFVILCSETDQYHKYMPDIQERLADSLRLPQVIPSIQAQVFLCFRVLLLRMSPQHATSLWPVIVSELVQVFLHIEQELNTDTEEFSRQNSSHLKLLSALDSSWTVNANNGLQAHGHPHWLQLQLAAAKLLDLAMLLPAHKLPQFQMYRWAFVGDTAGDKTDNNNSSSDFVPHITRIARLMDAKFNTVKSVINVIPGELLLTSNKIYSLQDLHLFFSGLRHRSNDFNTPLNVTQLETVTEQDFLDSMPFAPTR